MSVRYPSRGCRRIGFALAVQLVLALTVLLPAGPAASSAAAPKLVKVEARVHEQIAAKGAATFFVNLRDRADLGGAAALSEHHERTAFVYKRLRDHAKRSQARLLSLLASSKVEHKPFWIANTVRVTAGNDLLEKIVALPEVERVVAERRVPVPKPAPGKDLARIQAIEWNIDRIRAPEVWSAFNDRGDGIVVANVDTGAQFDHPALVRQYRGNMGGAFDHNYNWFDPSQMCGSPSLVPCDNNGHGTHTMGTMVGADGQPSGNEIGVAPNARWIAAKGCEFDTCSDTALLASGQWIVAPTDLAGQNPRPDLAPHVVNNSWGSGPGDPFYQDIVAAWTAAGIFPVFSIGNSGPGCGSAGSPGDFPNSYGVGAFDINNAIADFSSRGASAFDGEIKPNLAAPGVDVRSSVPGGGYESFQGTSMAAPHVAGTVALMWSAAPSLLGQIDATRQLLDDTAVDTEDLQCGGTADDNNVWGEGRLDAFTAVDAAPRGPTGTLRGAVVDQSTGNPVEGASVRVTGPSDRTTFTGVDGTYTITLPVGTYDLAVQRFGYIGQSASGVVVAEGETTSRDFVLAPAPAHSVSGAVRDDGGNPLAGVPVRIAGTPIPPAITAADGSYRFPSVPEGQYDVTAEPLGCNEPQTRQLVVDGDEVLDFTAPRRHDNFGHFCVATPAEFADAGTVLPLSGDDASTQVELPFPVTFYGQSYTSAHVTTNGSLNFLAPDTNYVNEPIPSGTRPNAALYPFWDDLVIDDSASVRTEVLGAAPNRRFVVEWDNAAFLQDFSRRVSFQAVLAETGHVTFQYQDIDDNGLEQGGSATIGIENEVGDDAFQVSFGQPQVSDGVAIRFEAPPSGFVQGTVTNANDGTAVAGARIRALQDGVEVRHATTDANGRYRISLPLGAYQVEASARNYSTEATDVVLDQRDEVLTRDFALRAARAEVSPAALDFVVPSGETRTGAVTLTNTGSLDLTWQAGEARVPTGTNAGNVKAPGPGVNSHTPPAGYTPKPARSVRAGGPVLVLMDALPWGSDALTQVLTTNGIPFDTADSAQMASVDLSPYDVVMLANDQPASFYANYNANRARFEDYVGAGGFLWVGAAAWGFNFGDFDGGVLPGGATVHGPVFEGVNDVIDNAHPTVQGIADPFTGFAASHATFADLPPDANVIARGQDSQLPTLVEYGFGAGRVLAFGQTLEHGWMTGEAPGRILENSVPYAYAFVPIVDIPWLAEDPASGTLAPGAAQRISVTVDTTGLAPGVYRARIVLVSNDPRNPRLQIPVTVTVPAYHQAVNAGNGPYTDVAGDGWSADQRYTAGGFGYTNRNSTVDRTTRAIAGTDDDPLYQTQRVNPVEYRFDGLPAGVYEIDLRFAEVTRRQPNTRLFDVIAERTLLLPAHDVAGEVGSFAANQHTARVSVTDGQLNLRFVERRGFSRPIVNAIRVIHRPEG